MSRRLPGRAGAWVADGALLAAAFVWGITFVVVSEALGHAPPLFFLALRFTSASVLLLPWALLRHGPPDGRSMRAGGLVGLWLFIGFALQTAGLTETPPARAAFITGLSVVLVPILLVLVYRGRPAAGSLAGVALAAVGLALLTGVGHGGVGRGDLLVFGGAAAFAMQILAVNRWAASIGPARLLLPELTAVALLSWCGSALLETWPSTIHPVVWKGVAITALLATLGALWAQNWAQQRTPPTRAAVILTLEPVFAALYSYLATGERYAPRQAVGAFLILAGMLAAELLPRRAP